LYDIINYMNKLNWATKENAVRPNNFDADHYELLHVNALDMMNNAENDFKLDPYDRTGGENAIGIRLPYAIEYFKSEQPMDYPEAYYSKYTKKVGFDNGRHRTIAAFQLGEEYVPMFVYTDGIDEFKKLVRTKPVNPDNIEEFIEKKSPRNFSRKEFFNYIFEKFKQPNSKHSIDNLNQITIALDSGSSNDMLDNQYMKDNGYFTEKDFLLDTDTFLDVFKELKLKEDELNSLPLDYSITSTYNEILEEEQNIVSFNFDFNEFYDLVCNQEKKILVFRIENENGNGPYKDISVTKTSDPEKNPNAESDNDLELIYHMYSSKIPYTKEYKFGFNSLDKLKSWFHDNSDIEKMALNGFKIAVYKLPLNHTLNSKHQDIYNVNTATLIDKIELQRFFRPDLKNEEVSLRPARVKKQRI
jgi:hypothetical protein